MSANNQEKLAAIAERNVRSFTCFRMFFNARFYYPVYALLFLDYGLTLEQFGILNAIWAVTIVLSEVPSGALADTIGRRNLLIGTGVLMVLEMGVLLLAPIGGGTLMFGLFVVNRILSGVAEAAASGADEALTYDSLKAAGQEDRWGKVLERVQRDTSIAFFFAMMIGAAVYDAKMVNAVFGFFGATFSVEPSQLVKLPIVLTFISGLVVLAMALRMQEAKKERLSNWGETVGQSWRQTVSAARWIWVTALPFGIIAAVMAVDSVIRQFLTLASEYWNVIKLPIASYGLIGSGMALLGLFMPTLARKCADRYSPLQNFLLVSALVLLGSWGLGLAIPYWGILPAVLLYASMQMTGYFVSRYLNEVAPSAQRATVLSFKGLCTNFSYGLISVLYSGLITSLKVAQPDASQSDTFIQSLAYFPVYFLVAVGLVFIAQKIKFRGQA